jgi:hypothetical protein
VFQPGAEAAAMADAGVDIPAWGYTLSPLHPSTFFSPFHPNTKLAAIIILTAKGTSLLCPYQNVMPGSSLELILPKHSQ